MYKSTFKRVIDIIISILFLPILLLSIIIFGPIIYLQDNGNIFYNSKRLGLNGRIFKMYKFRSMKLNAPDIRNNDGSTFNSEDDPRLIKIGKFIRKSSIDEIPQVLNVLKGDMSLIGPRPDLPEHYDMYTEEEKGKLAIRPGLSGYNQAYYRNTIPWKQRIKNDLYYIDKLSFMFDIKIIFKTIFIILSKKNVYIDSNKQSK